MTGRLRLLGSAVAQRLRLLGWACVLAALSLAGLGLLALILVALPLLAVFPAGVWLLLSALRLVRGFADANRWVIGSTLHDGRPLGYGSAAFDPGGLRALASLPPAQSPQPSGGRWRQLRTLAGESATRRDLAWLLLTSPAGLVVAFVVGVSPAVCLHFASLPVVRPAQSGVWTVNSAFIGIPIGLVGLVLWWWAAPPVLHGYALLSRRLLGSAATAALTTQVRRLVAARSAPVSPAAAAPARQARLESLTPREREVLALVAEGRTNAAIAARLYISEKAVDKHITSMFRKLDLTNSAEDNRRVLAALSYLRD
ncbi:LuxR C-terminal-related transcriptional regulator [Rhizomonospora bruguierae]|uniref:LuxR C-terminal-related transcriptional regulator n=1 Tax=Rhizomonospora bruguierae TaxID=1581705 RepID=UPI0035E41A73